MPCCLVEAVRFQVGRLSSHEAGSDPKLRVLLSSLSVCSLRIWIPADMKPSFLFVRGSREGHFGHEVFLRAWASLMETWVVDIMQNTPLWLAPGQIVPAHCLTEWDALLWVNRLSAILKSLYRTLSPLCCKHLLICSFCGAFGDRWWSPLPPHTHTLERLYVSSCTGTLPMLLYMWLCR